MLGPSRGLDAARAILCGHRFAARAAFSSRIVFAE
jgi:hypothetical protein